MSESEGKAPGDVALGDVGKMDADLYGSSEKFAGYTTELREDVEDEVEDDGIQMGGTHPATRAATKRFEETEKKEDEELMKRYQEREGVGRSKISARESEVCTFLIDAWECPKCSNWCLYVFVCRV